MPPQSSKTIGMSLSWPRSFNDHRLTPKRLGVAMTPKFINTVLVQPSCSIIGKYPDDVRIHRMDSFVKIIRAEDRFGIEIFKLVAPDTLHAFAADLLAHHKPAPVAEPAKPSSASASPGISAPSNIPSCQGCGGPLTTAEANYCRTNKAKFAGALLCRKCQGLIPKEVCTPAPVKAAIQPDANPEIAAHCAGCGAGVDRKVIAFCRFNSKRFGGRILCRTCQTAIAN